VKIDTNLEKYMDEKKDLNVLTPDIIPREVLYIKDQKQL
jgi:hypothetical protein